MPGLPEPGVKAVGSPALEGGGGVLAFLTDIPNPVMGAEAGGGNSGGGDIGIGEGGGTGVRLRLGWGEGGGCPGADDGGGVTLLGLLGSLNADGGAGVRRRVDVGGADNVGGDGGGGK
jgi:hypothetical protein